MYCMLFYNIFFFKTVHGNVDGTCRILKLFVIYKDNLNGRS